MKHLPLILVIALCLVLGGAMGALAADGPALPGQGPVKPCQFWEVCSIAPAPVASPWPTVLWLVIVAAAFIIAALWVAHAKKGN